MLRDVVAQGPSKSRRIKIVDGYCFPRAMLMLRGEAIKTGYFPEQANSNGVMGKSQRTGGKRVPVPSHKQPGTDADSPP